MKKLIVGMTALAVAAVVAVVSPASASNPPPLKFMSYNICVTEPWCTDASPYSLSVRKSHIYDRVDASTPDVLAVQEGSGLFNGVTDMAYDSAGNPTPVIDSAKVDGTVGNISKYFKKSATGVNYRVGFYPVDDQSGIGIYVNPSNVGFSRPIDIRTQQVGTDGTGRLTPRYVTFTRLYDKRTDEKFWVGVTHLTDGAAGATDRLDQMEAINTLADTLPGPVLLLGDFNEYRTPTSDPLLPGWSDSMDSAGTLQSPQYNSYRGWQSSPRTSTEPLGQHIDRGLIRGPWSVTKWAIQSPSSPKASDHLPVVIVAQPLPDPTCAT